MNRNVLGPFYFIVGVLPLVAANLAMATSVVARPFSRDAFFRMNFAIAWAVWAFWDWGARAHHGTKLILSGDELPDGESAIVIANHQGMVDAIVLLGIALDRGRTNDLRFLVKNGLRYVPFLGWCCLFLDFLFLKRDWDKDRDTIRTTFERYRTRTLPLWLVLFPEGTRRTPKKQESSLRHAMRTGLPATKHVMLPRPKGFVASVQGLRGKVGAVYSLTIDFGGKAPSFYEMAKGEVSEIRVHVKRTALSDLPDDERELSAWLQRDFAAKDSLLEGWRKRS